MAGPGALLQKLFSLGSAELQRRWQQRVLRIERIDHPHEDGCAVAELRFRAVRGDFEPGDFFDPIRIRLDAASRFEKVSDGRVDADGRLAIDDLRLGSGRSRSFRVWTRADGGGDPRRPLFLWETGQLRHGQGRIHHREMNGPLDRRSDAIIIGGLVLMVLVMIGAITFWIWPSLPLLDFDLAPP
ncbi:MAG: hypothetical protein KDA25_13175 [Phycisphaerales bacterium]|nr:hypothetical protein [Phycisphaerales bacterium]